ncbi:MAG: branched-chain amino acid ABC transporter permease [Clostridia bacterium]|nr:branched-chain amino acid ABC transporter permease [Clostridia bacterium]
MKKRTKIICSVVGLAAMFGFIYYVGQLSSVSMMRTSLQMGAIYALLAVSMNLLNGVTGQFSLGQAGFMTLGAYTYAILTIPVSAKTSVYYLYGVADFLENISMPIVPALIIAGLVAAFFALLIGAPVLRLKSDYFAIATLGFAEVVRIVVASSPLNKITNGSLGLNSIPSFDSYYSIFVVVIICIAIMGLIKKSTYGRSFKAIRDDEVAAEAMGINLAKHKMLSFTVSSFFAGIGGALLAMYLKAISATTFTISSATYYILLMVVIGGMGSFTGSIIASMLVIFAKEWWLRFLDVPTMIGGLSIPLLRPGFRMVIFSVILMVVVLFFRSGIMGDKEFSWDALANFFGRIFKKKQKEVQ